MRGLYLNELVVVKPSARKYTLEDGLDWEVEPRNMFLLIGKTGMIGYMTLVYADVKFLEPSQNSKFKHTPGVYRLSLRCLRPYRDSTSKVAQRNVILNRDLRDIKAAIDPLTEGKVARQTRSSVYENPYPLKDFTQHQAFKKSWFRLNEHFKERCLKELMLLLTKKRSMLLLDEKFMRSVRTNKMEEIQPRLTEPDEIHILFKYGFAEIGYTFEDEKEFTNNYIYS